MSVQYGLYKNPQIDKILKEFNALNHLLQSLLWLNFQLPFVMQVADLQRG
jgi:hypothetical protein